MVLSRRTRSAHRQALRHSRPGISHIVEALRFQVGQGLRYEALGELRLAGRPAAEDLHLLRRSLLAE
jgi:hypothetical protein